MFLGTSEENIPKIFQLFFGLASSLKHGVIHADGHFVHIFKLWPDLNKRKEDIRSKRACSRVLCCEDDVSTAAAVLTEFPSSTSSSNSRHEIAITMVAVVVVIAKDP